LNDIPGFELCGLIILFAIEIQLFFIRLFHLIPSDVIGCFLIERYCFRRIVSNEDLFDDRFQLFLGNLFGQLRNGLINLGPNISAHGVDRRELQIVVNGRVHDMVTNLELEKPFGECPSEF